MENNQAQNPKQWSSNGNHGQFADSYLISVTDSQLTFYPGSLILTPWVSPARRRSSSVLVLLFLTLRASLAVWSLSNVGFLGLWSYLSLHFKSYIKKRTVRWGALMREKRETYWFYGKKDQGTHRLLSTKDEFQQYCEDNNYNGDNDSNCKVWLFLSLFK